MLAKIMRALLGVLLLPACFAFGRSFCSILVKSDIPLFEGACLVLGVVAFILCWVFLSHPVKTYVFGHELTHAFWGLLFLAKPSRLKVGEKGGSVNLTKTNFLITLAPYFFPFYTFLIIVAALITMIFVNPLPMRPLWIFFIGFTWAFHILFTFETLSQRQPDITLYGRLFSWTFIFIANVLVVLLWLSVVTSIFGFAVSCVWSSLVDAYSWTFSAVAGIFSLIF